MKTLDRIIVAGLCGWVLWIIFGAIFLTDASGSSGWGGFPVADGVELHDYLTQRGFTFLPATNHVDRVVERFCGSYHGSRPIFVTITTQATNRLGVSVETYYHFSGFVRSVDDSSAKAQEFAQVLNRWLENRSTREMNLN